MATKPIDKPKAASTNQIQIAGKPNETEEEGVSRAATMPSVSAAVTISAYSKKYGKHATIKGLMPAVREQINAVQAGDLTRAEAMLIAQAHSLDAIFNELAQRAAANIGEYMNAVDIYLRLALKAQGQCRATLETLAEIKFPKSATFVRQQNVGINQQVNNGESMVNDSRAPTREDLLNSANKLLEQDANESQQIGLDTGTTSTASGFNRELEAVGALDRPSEQAR